MKFHTAILQPNGRVCAKQRRDSEAIARDEFSAKVMNEFRQLLATNFTVDPTRCGKFRAQFANTRQILEWQQVEPLSAMGKFLVRRQVIAASFYMHGFVPELDDAILEATEALFVNWFGAGNARGACRGLRSIKERPVLIVVPASKEVLSPDDWRIVGNLSPCLAAVLFQRAEAAIKAIEKFWTDLGYRKGGQETDHLWN